VAKYNIDDILNELGADDSSNKDSRANTKKHRVDQAEQSFSPLPSVPANQRAFGSAAPDALIKPDPAVKSPLASSAPSVGPAISEIYRPEKPDPTAEPSFQELGALLGRPRRLHRCAAQAAARRDQVKAYVPPGQHFDLRRQQLIPDRRALLRAFLGLVFTRG